MSKLKVGAHYIENKVNAKGINQKFYIIEICNNGKPFAELLGTATLRINNDINVTETQWKNAVNNFINYLNEKQ
jgi:hypothetical protein